MARDVAVVLAYTPWTRYSVNALASILDLHVEADVYLVERLENTVSLVKFLLDRYRRVVLGIGLNTIMLTDNRVLKEIKRINRVLVDKRVLRVAGGPHATGDPLGTLYSLGFDVAVVGEGEETLVDLVNTFSSGGDIHSVKGIYTVVDGEPKYTSRRRPVELDKYPPFPIWRRIAGPIEITRGCPYGCRYCQVSYMHGFQPRHRSIDNIVYHVESMARHGFHDIRFITPDGLGYGLGGRCREPRLEAIEELLHRLWERVCRRYGARIFYGTFPSEFRPEHIVPDVVRVLRRYVSNKSIIVGAQSGSDRVLELIGRGHSVDDVYHAVEALVKNGFRADVDFIIGLPGETRDDLLESLHTMRKLVSMGARIHLHVFMPLPGTPFSQAPPGHIPDWLKREVYRLIGSGSAYGQWIRQEEIARKIDWLRRKGIILPRRNKIHS